MKLRVVAVLLLLGASTLGTSTVAASTSAAAKGNDAYYRTGFEVLAGFPFEPPEPDPAKPGTPPPSAANQIPPAVKALDGRKIVVSGYMMPLKMDKGLVTELLLMANSQLCCYGAVPKLNEFIYIKMTGEGVKHTADVPVEFYGRMTVKEVFEEGFLQQIYTMAGDKMGKAAVE